jgi:hypothetical protein
MDPGLRRPWTAVLAAACTLLIICQARGSLQPTNTTDSTAAFNSSLIQPLRHVEMHATSHCCSMLRTASSNESSCSENALGAPVALFVPTTLASHDLQLLVAFQPGSRPDGAEKSAYQR